MTDDGVTVPKTGFASQVEGETYAVTDPSTSRLIVSVPPDDPKLLHLIVVSLREELMHGERQKFGPERNEHLFKQQARRALDRYLSGDLDAEQAAKTIVRCRSACRRTVEGRRKFVETIDKYLTLSSFDEPGYLEEQLERYAERNDVSVEDLTYEWERSDYRDEARVLDGVFEDLQRLERDFDTTVAEAVAHVALDDPTLIQPLGDLLDGGHEADQPWEADILHQQNRFETAEETARRLGRKASLTDLGRDDLRRRIKREMPGDQRHPRPLQDLPLLDRPSRSLRADQVTRQGFEAVQQAPTEIDMVLNGAFQFVGNLGGVVYQRDEGDWVSLLNPWVADGPNGHDDYRQQWMQEVAGDTLVTWLLKTAAGAESVGRRCFLCRVSPGTGHCGDGECAWEPSRKLDERSVRRPLLDALSVYNLEFVTMDRGEDGAERSTEEAMRAANGR